MVFLNLYVVKVLMWMFCVFFFRCIMSDKKMKVKYVGKKRGCVVLFFNLVWLNWVWKNYDFCNIIDDKVVIFGIL